MKSEPYLMSPGPTLPDVIPLCELQFGLQEALRLRQGETISCRAKEKRFYYDRTKTKLSSFVYFLFDDTDVKYVKA
jgi:hypothetical protein